MSQETMRTRVEVIRRTARMTGTVMEQVEDNGALLIVSAEIMARNMDLPHDPRLFKAMADQAAKAMVMVAELYEETAARVRNAADN